MKRGINLLLALLALCVATTAWGGYPLYSDARNTAKCDLKEGGNNCSNCPGMPRYSVHAMLVSLSIEDTPVHYQPAFGPAVPTGITYSQREAYQPASFSYYNLGQKWTFDGLSYIRDDPTAAGNKVMIYLPGGGVRDYTGYNAGSGTFTPEQRAAAHLIRTSGDPIRYERRLASGTTYIYAQSDGSTVYPRRIFLSQILDAAGNAVTLHYDP